MKRFAVILFILSAITAPIFPNILIEKGKERLKAFYTMTDPRGMDAVLKGVIISYSSKDEYDENDLFGRAQDKSKATVRLYNTAGMREGDTLFVINQQNLIVAKMKIRTIFRSESFGDMLVGYGNFRLSSVGDRVIQKSEDENAQYSYIYKARGDYYNHTGKQGEAIREYKSSLKLDADNPAAHLALGLVYMHEGLNQYALKEFQEGYRNLSRLYDNEDKFILLKSMAEIRFKDVYETFAPEKLKEHYRTEGVKFCKEALQIYPQSEQMNYYLGVFYYRSSNPDDKAAKESLLRVIDINPSHADAYVALSELYFRHENMNKARLYAEKALESDRTNKRAQKLLKYIRSKEEIK